MHQRKISGKKNVRKRGLEPLSPYEHYPLKVACLPISPLPQRTVQNYILLGRNARFGDKKLFRNWLMSAA